ncbi:hypothetical protein VKT23_017428 [Stygiomarasmius scandens]|uniref:DUF676 domain-containing protein n=1 Tax=Marasmiellus scandens TaxID=2682957 RepID=A0ABR1IVC6_9AGAR
MQVHLHVLLHGLWGNAKHLESAARVFTDKHNLQDTESQSRIQLLIIEANQGTKTYDGIEWGAERAAKEILETARQIEEKDQHITKFSITGYSLGGLYARYVIAILHASDFFADVRPMNFATIATPHLGMPNVKNSLLARLAKTVGSNLLGNTGRQVFGIDDWAGTGRPWLEIAADKGSIFWEALNAFQHINIYANAINDRMVPYMTGAFESEDPFAKVNVEDVQVEFEEGYKPVMKSWREEKTSKSLTWSQRFKTWKPLPFLGPFIQWNFPYNLILMAMSPFILLTLLFVIPVTFLLSSRASQSRAMLLQADLNKNEAYLTRMKSFTNLRKQVEQATENIAEHAVPVPIAVGDTTIGSSIELSPSQKRMVTDLNQLTNLRKHLVWIHPVRNAHAIIICREELQFPEHALGKGVLEHWADHFTL